MWYLSDVESVAHHVIDRCTQRGHSVSNLQLHKILYFLQVVYCRTRRGESLLFKENFEAWPYGPVIPSIYHEYSEYGGRPIGRRYPDSLDCDAATLEFLNEGIDILSAKTPWDLVSISHAKGSPWDKVFQGGSGYKHVIDNKLIVEAAMAGVSR